MARKKTTDTAALLSQTILFRVRQQEYEKLLKLAQNSDCRSVGEVVRRILEKRRIILFHRDTSLDGVVEELAGVREELRAIGVNINQITRHFNASTQAHKRVFLAQQALEQYRLGRAESQHVAHAPFSTSPPMVLRIITGKSIRGALRYNEHKVEEGQAALLLTHRFLQEPHTLRWEDKLRRFERLTGKNPRVKTNCVHISLNFAIGEELSKERLQHIATDYMDRIGFGGQPYLVYQHLDAAHPHLHIVTTNLQPDGKRINLHNLGRNRSEPARKALEMAYGLKPAEGQKEMSLDALLRLPLSPARYGASETKRSIAHIVSVVTRTYSYTSLAELNAALGAFRVQADRGGEQTQMFRRGGLHYRLLDQLGQAVGVPLKASSLPGKPTLAALEKRFAQHKLLRKPLRDKLRQTLDETLQTHRPHDRASLAACLERVQVQVLFRESSGGQVYGVTFLDHGQRAVFNGSELGKSYSAKAFLARLTTSDVPAGRQAGKRQEAPVQVVTQGQAPTPHQDFHTSAFLHTLIQADPQAEGLAYELRKQQRKRKRRRPKL